MPTLKLATLIDNPGEPPVESRYRDPAELESLGYNALAIYETTALSGLVSPEVIGDAELRRWIHAHMDHIEHAIASAHARGLAVYLFYDALVLPEAMVRAEARTLTCKHARELTLCPGSAAAVARSVEGLEAMMRRWPQIAGVVLRFGETDAHRLPHLLGNDIYSPRCPRCAAIEPAERVVNLVERCHRLVVEQMDRQLIVRAWNIRPGGMHDSPELARRIVERLPGPADEPRLMLSFKFTETDFWRYQRWNRSSLVCGARPILYELQCQREYEGKGGIPNWQTPLWRDGYPEMRQDSEVAGLAQASERVNLAGLWAWVRGGGWGGPFVSDETWIDANVHAVPRLAEDPHLEPGQQANHWLGERLGVGEPTVARRVMSVLEGSPEFVRKLFYIGPFARARAEPWHPSGDWIQDDLLDVRAIWRLVQRLSPRQLDEAVREKEDAATQLGADRAALQKLAGESHHPLLEHMVNTLLYAESLCETLRDLIAGLAAYRRFQADRSSGAGRVARQKLLAAQSHWNHHTQRHGSLPGAATAFREVHFWELTQQIIVETSEAIA